jgi:apolipoprotein N-acyltransferase
MASLDKDPWKNRWSKVWPAIASAILIVAAFPPLRAGLLVFVGLVPWLIYLRECDGKRAFRSGMLFGFVFWLGELSFIAQFVARWTKSDLLGLVPYLLGCLIACFYFAIFGWAANICYRRSIPWAVPLVWAGVEVFRSYVYILAFPFGLIAMPLTQAPSIIQTAHYGTVYLTSAWVVLANVIFAELFTGKRYAQVRWYATVFILLLALSVARFSVEPTGETRRVVAGQPGVDMAFSDAETVEARLGLAVDQISAKAAGADLLVLPEGVARAGDTMPPTTPFSVHANLPVVFGGQRGIKPTYQSAFSYDGRWGFADKTRLVVFGEYVPFREHLPFLDSFKLPEGDLQPSDKVTSLDVGKFRVGGALCFEALFPDVTYRHALNGANILAVMSIDDWYFGTNAPEQLRDASCWRAIETGLPVVRAAPLGYSDVIDARGRIVAEAPLSEARALEATVKVGGGDLFPLLPVFPCGSFLFLLGVPLYDRVLRRREAARE